MFDAAFWETWWKYFSVIIWPSIFATIRMLIWTMFFGIVFGFLFAILLVIIRPGGLHPNKALYRVLDFIVNLVRSFPVIILIVAMSPITRMVVGTTIGEKAAILPLAITATPFLARIFENAMIEVDPQLIEAARSFGASDVQIIFRVMVKESIPSILSGTTLAAINYLSCTTMAGAVGAGGLGAVALNYGYQSFNYMVLYTGVIILCIMVQIIQILGNKLYKKSVS